MIQVSSDDRVGENRTDLIQNLTFAVTTRDVVQDQEARIGCCGKLPGLPGGEVAEFTGNVGL
jgi:hypothetical protein